MIFDRIANIKQYKGISYNLDQAIDFLRTTNIKEIQGAVYEIDEDHVFARIMDYDTKAKEDGVLEAHKKYIDIHIMIEGKEKVLVSDMNDLEIVQEYSEDKDCAFYKGEMKAECIIQDDYFVICFPNDVHTPSVRVSESEHVKKMVIKVRV